MKILIVDDNDRYANNLKAFFDSKKIIKTPKMHINKTHIPNGNAV